ncbi:MAG: TolC family protein, partial [Spirochaetales bacterium]|nr:TolC family protein [Spirochaetales bacterium]
MKSIFVLALFAALLFPAAAQDKPPLSMTEASGLARENSRELSIENLEIAKAAAGIREAKAGRGPQVKIQGSGSYMTNPMEGFKIEKGAFGYAPTPQSEAPIALPDQDYVLMEDAENTYFRITTTLSQPVFTFGKLANAVQAAELELRVSETEYETTDTRIQRDLRRAYFGVVFADETTDMLKKAENTAAAIVADREQAFTEGVVTRQNVLEAQAGLASLSSQFMRAVEGGRTARKVLSLLVGKENAERELSNQ